MGRGGAAAAAGGEGERRGGERDSDESADVSAGGRE